MTKLTLADIPSFMHEALLDNGWKDGWSNWSRMEVVRCWLGWEGIRGYTERLTQAFQFVAADKENSNAPR